MPAPSTSLPPRPRTHRAIGGWLAVVSLLAACQLQVAPVPTAKKSPRADDPARPAVAASGKPVGPATSVVPTASAKPGVAGASTAPLVALDLLEAPPGAHTLVTGAVTLDGSYIVAAGAGNILSHNGGQLVAAGAGNILSHNGGQVLSHNGGLIVAAGAGNVISPNGGALVAAGAGNLLSHNGGQLVAAGAGNILSHNGGQLVAAGAGNLVAAGAGNLVAAGAGNLVAAGAGNYALLQALPAAGPAGTVAAGTLDAGAIAPVAGVEIAVRSLRTGRYLPLGVDAKGQPVYVIYTNLAGKYDLYVPESEQGNVMIEAAVMREKADPRLEYQNISGVAAGIDEDTTLVTEVLRRSIATRMRVMFRKPDREAAMRSLFESANTRIKDIPGAQELLEGAFGKVWAAAHEAGLTSPTVPDATRLLYAFAVTDALLRKFDVQATMIQPGVWWDGPEEPAIPALVQIVRQAREKATAAMREDPAFVTKQPWFVAVNERAVRSGRRTAPYEIRRPADLGTLVVDEFIVIDPEDTRFDFSPPLTGGSGFHLDALVTAFDSVGANGVPQEVSAGGRGEGPTRRTKDGRDQVDRLNQAQFQIVLQMVAHLVGLGPDAEKEILDTLRAFRDQPPAPASPAVAPATSPSPATP